MLNGLKRLTSGVLAVFIAITFVGAFTRLNTAQVNADTTKTTTTNTAAVTLSGKARMQKYGNKKGSFRGGVLTLGKRGKKKNIRNITINFKNNTGYSGGIRYKVYVGKKGWTGWKTSGQKAGTKSSRRRIEGVRIELTGELAKHYSVVYSAYMQTFKTNQGWVSDGATAGAPAEGKRLEEIKVKLVPRENLGEQPTVVYRMYRDKYKWSKKWYRNGEISGVTSGKHQKSAGLMMAVTGSKYTGNIEYRVRGEGYSWLGWCSNNTKTGKYGKNKRIEGVQMRLTGELAEHFDVYYRVKVRSKGWLGWAKNGQSSGTEKFKYYIMALQCVIVPKGSAAPGDLKGVKSAVTSAYLINGNPVMQFSEFKKNYKTDKTMVGVDVSKYQGDINFKKMKAAGCEFVILRCYVRNNYYSKSKKKYVWCNAPDTKFETYYKAAKAAGLKVGVYFFTCDYTEENMRKYTQDMIKKCKLKEKQLDFPIAFDWENYDYYKRAHKSKKWTTAQLNSNAATDLNKVVAVFEEEVEKAGFSASIYGSKSRLETTWKKSITAMNKGQNHLSIWLAHWVLKSSYSGKFYMWQVNSHGKINGISGEVDMDVAYIDRLPSPKAPEKPGTDKDDKTTSGSVSVPAANSKDDGKTSATEKDNAKSAKDSGTAESNSSSSGETSKAPAEDKTKSETEVPAASEGSEKGKDESGEPAVTKPSEDKQETPAKDTEPPKETAASKETESAKATEPVKEKEPAKEPVKEKETEKESDSAKEEKPAKVKPSVKEAEPAKQASPSKEAVPAKEASPKEQHEEVHTEGPK